MKHAVWVTGLLLLTACGSSPERPATPPADTAAVASGAPTLAGLLGELEAHLVSTAVTSGAGDPVAGSGARVVARRLAALEQRLTPGATAAGWKERRVEWREELDLATTDYDVALCLAELESSLARSALQAGWKVRRPLWIWGLRRAVGLAPDPTRRERVVERGTLWVVRNQTQKLLILRWSGPMTGKKVIGPGRETSIPLQPGHYVVRGSAPGVEPKISVHEFEPGYRYTQTFGVE